MAAYAEAARNARERQKGGNWRKGVAKVPTENRQEGELGGAEWDFRAGCPCYR